mmetsp:Transcript_23094/g.72672  ORF Transcript_23094/g.72672 Transcript_23094/m.72672 type:complete len:399 (+) Transcript_23094:1004-2200(+)
MKAMFSSVRRSMPFLSSPWKMSLDLEGRSKPNAFIASTNSSRQTVLVPSLSMARKAASTPPKRFRTKTRKLASTSAPWGSSSSRVTSPLSSLSSACQSSLASSCRPTLTHALKNWGLCSTVESSGLNRQRQARRRLPYLRLRSCLNSSRPERAACRCWERLSRSSAACLCARTFTSRRCFSASNHLKLRAQRAPWRRMSSEAKRSSSQPPAQPSRATAAANCAGARRASASWQPRRHAISPPLSYVAAAQWRNFRQCAACARSTSCGERSPEPSASSASKNATASCVGRAPQPERARAPSRNSGSEIRVPPLPPKCPSQADRDAPSLSSRNDFSSPRLGIVGSRREEVLLRLSSCCCSFTGEAWRRAPGLPRTPTRSPAASGAWAGASSTRARPNASR